MDYLNKLKKKRGIRNHSGRISQIEKNAFDIYFLHIYKFKFPKKNFEKICKIFISNFFCVAEK